MVSPIFQNILCHGNFLLLDKVPESEDEIEEELVEKKETVLCELQGNGLYKTNYATLLQVTSKNTANVITARSKDVNLNL